MEHGGGDKPGAPEMGSPGAGAVTPAEVILRLAWFLTPGVGLEERAAGILETACPLLGSSAAWLLVRHDGELRLAAARDLSTGARHRLGHLPLDAPAIEPAALRSGHPVSCTLSEEAPELEWSRQLLEEVGLPAATAIPARHGETEAVVVLARDTPLAPEELPTAEALARIGVRGIAATWAPAPAAAEGASPAAELERIRLEFERCRRVEAELRDSEQRFRLTVDEAPIGIAVVSLTGRYLRVNKMLCEILGYTEEELLSMRWQDVTHPDDLACDLDQRDTLVDGRIPRYEVDKRYVRKDGRVVTASVGVSLVRDAEGAPWYFISRVQDITERLAAEEALRAREQQLAEAQAIARVGHWEIDLETGLVTGSAEGLRIFGLPPDHGPFPLDQLVETFHPDDRERVVAAFTRAVKSGRPFEIVHRIVRSDGAVRTLHSRAAVRRGPAGTRVLGAIRDVTEEVEAARERERLLQALATERTWLDTLIERSPVAIILVSADGRMRANQRAHELFGSIPPDATPEGMAMHFCDAEGTPLPQQRMPLVRALAGEVVHAEEICFRAADGSYATGLVSAGPIRDDRGRQLGAVAICENITRLKELERMREEWTSVVAHDLRQPVTVIHAQAQLLARALARGMAAGGKIDHIVSAARQLNRMIGDLLDVSRLEARRLALRRGPLDLCAFTREVAERMEDELTGHEVRVRATGEVPLVEADPQRVEQILANLLSNAAKYGAPEAPIDVEVGARGEMVEVRVINEGPGIAAEEMPSLFDRFYRARSARDRAVAGLGLGLYITRGLVEAHGGTIVAASVPEEKTTFTFTLPIVAPPT